MRKHRFIEPYLLVRFFIFAVILAQSFLLSGCWDMVELEDRGFVLGIGLDKGEKQGEILVHYQIALPSSMYGEGGGEGDKTINLSISAPNITLANKTALTKINKVLNIEHIQVLVISEALAKEGIDEYLDFFFRDINMRRKTNVMVAKCGIKELFEISPKTALSTSHYLLDVIRVNEKRMHRISSKVDMLKILRNIREGNDYILATLDKEGEDIVVSGSAILLQGKLEGYLDPEETGDVKWMKDDISEGTVILADIEQAKGKIAFNISESKTKIKPIIKGDKVDFKVDIRTEGGLVEMEDIKETQTIEPDFIKAIEKTAEQEIKKKCISIMEKAQYGVEAEFLDLGHLVKQYHADWWEEHEKDWRKIFKESKLDIDVRVYLRKIGLTK